MNLIILAAGQSLRIFKKIKKNKCLIKIQNKTLIEKIIKDSKNIEIKKIIVVVGFLKKKLKKSLSQYKNIEFVDNYFYKKRDMLYSLFLGLKKSKDDSIVCYSDIYFSKKIFSILKISKNQISIPIFLNWKKIWKLRNKNFFDDAETLKINKKGYLIEIGNKIKNINDVDGQYMGIIFFKKTAIPKIIEFYNNTIKKNSMHITEFLNQIKNKIKIKCKKTRYYWYEFDDYDDLNFFSKKKL